MKNVMLLLCLLLYAGARTQAQNSFASPGAEWYYSGISSFYDDGLYFLLHAKVDGDSLIDGRTCQVIRQEGKEKRGRWQSGTLSWSPETQRNLRSFYVYNNNDTTFIYNEVFAKFTPLYIFNVTEGQTICLPAIKDIDGRFGGWPLLRVQPLTGDSSFCYVVDSIRMVNYDTSALKTIYTHAVFDSPGRSYPDYPVENWSHAGYGSSGAYIEKIGGWRGGLLPKSLYNTGRFDGMEPTQSLNLDCYIDNYTRIKLSAKACDYMPTTLGIRDVGRMAFTGMVYPNPARDLVTIQPEKPFEKDAVLTLYNVTGNTVLRYELPAGRQNLSLSLAGISPGVYYLSMLTENGRFYQKVVVQP